MVITSQASGDGQVLTIQVQGRFDFSTHQQFRDAYECAPVKPARIVVDLAGTTYIDSSALGMLLLLRDYAGGDAAQISVVNSNADVRKILAISNFEQLLQII